VHTLGAEAEAGTPFGMQVTALGVGLDYDEKMLNELAIRSSGRLFHLSDPKEMAGIITDEVELLQGTMATNAAIEIVPAPGVTIAGTSQGVQSAWGNRGGQRVLRVELGTMFAGQRRELLVRYRLNTDQVEGKKAIVSARLHYVDPSDGGVERVHEVLVRGELTQDPSLVAMHQNSEVQAIVAMQNAATFAMAARTELEAGRFDGADEKLAKAEADLRQRAQEAKSTKDRARMMGAADGIASSRRSVQKAAMAPPSAAPAAKRKESLELNNRAMDALGL
jgi:Ca-activated chloride channel family protein